VKNNVCPCRCGELQRTITALEYAMELLSDKDFELFLARIEWLRRRTPVLVMVDDQPKPVAPILEFKSSREIA
jgi:hypothetical protein